MSDHYSLEILAKLRQQELLREELHEQALRRLRAEARLPKQWKRDLLVAIAVIVSVALGLLV